MNTVDAFFLAVSAVFILMLVLVFFTRTYKSWIYNFFNGFFWLLILLIALFALKKSGPEYGELKITNYTSEKGNLFFFKEKGCETAVWYDVPVSNNEERFVEVENPPEGYGYILFVTSRDSLFSVPVPEPESKELDIWKKETEPAPDCYRKTVEEYQAGQKKFSLITGLALLAILILFWYRRKRKPATKKSIV